MTWFRWRALCGIALSIVLLSGCSQQPPTGAALAGRLDRAIESAMTAHEVPGVIVGLWSPSETYVRTFGVADEAAGTPMQTTFFHRIGSITKTFTVTAVLQLVDAGRVRLDDPIATYVDGVPRGEEVTLRHLAGMRSGLPDYTHDPTMSSAFYGDPHRSFTPSDLLHHAFAQPSHFAPGAEYEYSNTNAVLLGLVVEKVTGERLSDYLQKHVFAPSALTHTSLPVDSALPEPHATGYSENPKGTPQVATDWNPSWAWAAGGVISTLDDLRLWAKALATGTLLRPETQHQRLKTDRDGYGLGVFDVAGWIGHNGSVPGYQTVAVYLPERETTLVILLNSDRSADDGDAGTALATAITSIATPRNVYTLG